MIDEENYLEYREKRREENEEQNKCFKYNREILVIPPNGELEEINAEGYHFEKLYERFNEYEGSSKDNEYITAITGAKNGYVVFIIDTYSLCMFYPSSLKPIQSEVLITVLNRILNNSMVYGGMIEEQDNSKFKEWNKGREISIEVVKELINNIPLKEEKRTI